MPFCGMQHVKTVGCMVWHAGYSRVIGFVKHLCAEKTTYGVKGILGSTALLK